MCKQGDHEAIAYPSCSIEIVLGRLLRLGHQDQAGFRQPLAEHHATKLRFRHYYKGKVLLDLSEPLRPRLV